MHTHLANSFPVSLFKYSRLKITDDLFEFAVKFEAIKIFENKTY